MAHEAREFAVDSRSMWFHLHTSSSNVLLEKRAWACCWTGPSAEENEETSPREAIQGSRMCVELKQHGTIARDEADNVDSRKVTYSAVPRFNATGVASLTLPSGKVISLEARA